MSTLLVWQVEGHLGLSKTTLGMMRGESFAIVLKATSDGGYDHRSQGFDTPEEAEAYLLSATDYAGGKMPLSPTDYAGGKMLLPPTEVKVPAPQAVHGDSNDFKLWVVNHVVTAVDLEILHRKLASVTFTFGEPQPAFTR